jgi:hypothetical protein
LICPNDPFLPKPPELEDIIFNEEENDNERTTKNQEQVSSDNDKNAQSQETSQ